LQNIGILKFKQHRNFMGNIKTVTIRKSGAAWYVSFSCQYEFEIAPHTGEAVGIDVGIEFYASLSNGEQISNPRHFRKSEQRLAKSQRKLAGLKTLPKTDPKKRKAKGAVAKAHQKIRNQRRDFQHKTARKLAVAFSLIFVEALQITNLTKRPKPLCAEDGTYLPNGASAKSGLAKSINDAGWDTFISILSYKAVEAGGQVLKVNPKYTSQICPQCGNTKKKELSERWHSCECGCELPRDVAAAKNILAVGLHSLGSNPLEAARL
jgi:putative transposase